MRGLHIPVLVEGHDWGQPDWTGALNEPKDISDDKYLHGNAEYATVIQTSQKYVFDGTSMLSVKRRGY